VYNTGWANRIRGAKQVSVAVLLDSFVAASLKMEAECAAVAATNASIGWG
jgi:hypothetical protein